MHKIFDEISGWNMGWVSAALVVARVLPWLGAVS